MSTVDLHFESKKLPDSGLPDTPKEGEHLWVNYYPAPDKKDYIALPVACMRVYSDGSWDGLLEEGDA